MYVIYALPPHLAAAAMPGLIRTWGHLCSGALDHLGSPQSVRPQCSHKYVKWWTLGCNMLTAKPPFLGFSNFRCSLSFFFPEPSHGA